MARYRYISIFLLALWCMAGTAHAELPTLNVVTPSATKATLSSTLDTHSPETALYLCWRSTALYTSDDIPGCGGRQSTKEATGGVIGIKDNGDFVFVIDDLTPDKKYYYAYYLKEGSTVSDMRLFPEGFIAGSGIQTAVQVEQSFDERSYRLLSPLPGLAVLYDPGLCLELIAEGKLPPTYGPCNENDPSGFGWFINYAFQFLIGICAVLLVFRIMIEGYKYMTSDILFLKVNAKTKLGESFAGLALALAAYLLLNTINPRLVSQEIGVEGLEVGVDVYDRADDPAFMTRLQAYSTSGITGNINDETFLVYLAHQQGAGGAKAILTAAQNGSSVSSKIQRNMKNNFNRADARRTIGTDTLTPGAFLQYWSVRVEAVKRTGGTNIPTTISSALQSVSQETGVGLATLQAMCKIESGCSQSGITIVNRYGYAGLFQLSNSIYQRKSGVWEQYKKTNGTILDAYHNAYVGALLAKANLASLR